MDTLDQTDRERGRTKPRMRPKRGFSLVKPQTIKVLLALAPLATKLVQLVIVLVGRFRE